MLQITGSDAEAGTNKHKGKHKPRSKVNMFAKRKPRRGDPNTRLGQQEKSPQSKRQRGRKRKIKRQRSPQIKRQIRKRRRTVQSESGPPPGHEWNYSKYIPEISKEDIDGIIQRGKKWGHTSWLETRLVSTKGTVKKDLARAIEREKRGWAKPFYTHRIGVAYKRKGKGANATYTCKRCGERMPRKGRKGSDDINDHLRSCRN